MSDIFLTYTSDFFGLSAILSKNFTVENAGVRGASGFVWYEEEGIYIPNHTIVVGLVNNDFFQWVHCYGSIGVAVSNKMPVVLFLNEDTSIIRQQIASKWPSIDNELIFSRDQIDMMVAKIREILLKTNKSEFYINEYVKNGLYQQALSIIQNRIAHYQSGLNHGFRRSDCERELHHLCDRAAFVSAVLHRYDDFEAYLNDSIHFGDKQNVDTSYNKALRDYFLQYIKHPAAARPMISTDPLAIKARQYFEKADLLFRLNQEKHEHSQDFNNSDYIQLGNSIHSTVALFEKLSSHSAEYKRYLIECYERLIKYSRIIGDVQILQLLSDKMVEIKHISSDPEESDDLSNERSIKCIKAYLGRPLPDSQYFDVFISHKSEDYSMAHDVFLFLKSLGREVFFDKESLSLIGDSEYSNSILTAIDNSTHFILVCSDIAYLKSPWIQREYTLFTNEKFEGRKSGNVILVLEDKIYNEVIRSNKKILPLYLRSFEIMPFSSYKSKLVDYT